MPGERARTALAGTRFNDVRWVDETGSTNADVLDLARAGEPEGVVVVAGHQHAGRGRRGRTWVAPPGASLLCTVLLRPHAHVVGLTTTALGLAAVDAVREVAGVDVRMKWPNDLVWRAGGGDGDRKLAGVLAEAEWPAGVTASSGWREPHAHERVAVAAGIGINVTWPPLDALPPDVGDRAIALNHITPTAVDREDLLVAMLRALDEWYGALVHGQVEPLLDAWRARLATLRRRVRIELEHDDVEGTAVDVTPEGHLLVRTLDGGLRAFAAGDVIHLR